MRLCYGVLVLMILCKAEMGRAAEGDVRPQPFEGDVAISRAFAVKGVVREGVQVVAVLDERLSLMIYQ